MGSAEVLARYLPPNSNVPIELEVGSTAAVDDLLAAAGSLESDRGRPAVEFAGADGSTLVIAQTRAGAVLLWVDSLGDSFHSVGSEDPDVDLVVFDYFGAHTEVPAELVVPLDLGRAAAHAFLAGDHPTTAGLAMEPD